MLAQRIGLFGWIEEKHLDVPEEDGSEGFLEYAEEGNPPRSALRLTTDQNGSVL